MSKAGELTILTVNDHPAEVFELEITIEGDWGNKRFNHWVTDLWNKHKKIATIVPEANRLTVQVSPLNLSVLTTLSINTADQGIIE